MKKISICLVASISILVFSCNNADNTAPVVQKSDSTYAIIGKVTGLDSGTIYLIHRQTGKTDSTQLDHGFFKFNGIADTAEYCRISLNDQVKGFFLENGQISMLIKRDSLPFAQITGTKTQDEYNYYQEQFSKSLNDRMAIIDKAYDEAVHSKDKKSMDSLEKIYDALDLDQKSLVIEFVRSHNTSILSAYEVYANFSYNPRLSQLDSAYQMLDSSVKKTYFGRQLNQIIETTKQTAIGNTAPEFSCNDADGKPIALSSLRGQYVLVDFWASWCGPCRRENPTVVKAYHKFHDKGFEILGVSLDDTRADWLEAIKKDGLVWVQVSDLLGWKCAPAALYGVKGIPMNYLVDKNGIIVAKGLRGEDLDKKLAELIPG